MRLVLGVGFSAALSLLACTSGNGGSATFAQDGADGGSKTPKLCADGSQPAAAPPPPTSIDGDGPLRGDGEVRGTGGVAPEGCPEDHATSGSSGSASMSGPTAEGSAGSDESTEGGSSTGGSIHVEAGTVTAGVWDDNRNLDRFLSYRAQVAQTAPPGLLPIGADEHQAAKAALPTAGPKQKLDISLVIDTTGSMGDEIKYLQKEFDALASTIQSKFPTSEQHWSLVLYKDDGDDYVVRWFDFRADTTEFRAKLGEQSAGGGGDFPEAADRAVDVGTRLSWRKDANVAKLMFWVADAPHHAGTEQKLAASIRSAKNKGVHIYPVASSGIDELTELTMRSSAQLTGGRYLFLTNDSGVGGNHKEPSIPCYFVTKLDKAIVRMVDIEMSGTYREPDAAEVLRTGGNPQSGMCQLEAGGQVTIY